MRKLVAVMAVIIVLIAAPALVPAQMLPGMPTLPSFGLPAEIGIGNPSLYGGWVTNAGLTDYGVETGAAGLVSGTEESVAYDYSMSAFYVAGNLPISLGDKGSLLLSSSFTIPSTSPGRELLYSAGTLLGDRIWQADTFWGTVEATYVYPISETVSAVAGFRWVSWQTSYSASKIVTNVFGAFAPIDEADVTLNGYVPYIGLITTYRGLTVGAVGIPTTIGDLKHKESLNGLAPQRIVKASGTFTGGHFIELFAEYGLPLPGSARFDGDLSIFGKFSSLEIEASPSMQYWVGGVLSGEKNYDFYARRRLFLVGAKATLNFDMSNLFAF